MGGLRDWVRASRLSSQATVFFPLLLGQALAGAATGGLDWGVLVVVQLFGLFDQLYIVYANDVADLETDRRNRTHTAFSGGSRVLVDGALRPGQLRTAAGVCAAGALGCGVALGVGWGRWAPLPMMGLGLGLLWLYSYPPARLSYRGGGEFLQMVGVGVLLPLIGYTAQGATAAGFDEALWGVILPTQLACAVATALPDAPSDRRSAKRTLVVLLGVARSRRLVVGLQLAALLVWPLASWAGLWSATTGLVLLVPALALGAAALLERDARPATARLSVFVFLALLVTVALMAGMSVALLCR